MRRLRGLLLLNVLLVSVSREGEATLRLNEVLYDPPGADGDLEFVELYATAPIDLDGIELWFVNGEDVEGRRRIWTAPVGVVVDAGAWYLVGEEGVAGRDDTARLDLQNGPDAVWLLRDGEILDRLGWGEGAAGEGNPAADVSGRSLGRVPDGVDTDDNARDWLALDAPSPGARNRDPDAFVWVERRFEPTWSARPDSVALHLVLRAAGHAATQRGAWRCCGRAEFAPFTLARGDSLALRVGIFADLGRTTWPIELRAGDSSTASSFVESYHVGVGELSLEEVQARPLTGEPEWIELRAHADSVDVGAWSWRDRGGEPRRIGGDHRLGAGRRAVLTEDPGALERDSNVPQGVPLLRPESGWATLNDGADAAGIADVVELLDPDGVVVDRVELRARDFEERGRSLERVEISPHTPSLWLPCPVTHTLGRPNASSPERIPDSGLRVEPNPFTPDGDGVDDALRIVLHETSLAEGVEAEVRDLAGDRVCTLAGAGNGRVHQWLWDGRDAGGRRVPLGAYVVIVRDRESAGRLRFWRALVAVGGRR